MVKAVLWSGTKVRISQIRDEVIAPLIRVSPPVLRARTDMLYRQPELREVLPGRRHGGGDNTGLLATHAATALVLVAGLLDHSRENIGPEVARVWRGKCVTPTGNEIERYKTVGGVLTKFLQRADLRSRLLFLEIDKDVPHVAVVTSNNPDALTSGKPLTAVEWQRRIDDAVVAGEVSRTFFAPYTPKQWKKRVDRAFEDGEMAHVCRLAPATLNKIAALIS
jgi:hypothetical protein